MGNKLLHHQIIQNGGVNHHRVCGLLILLASLPCLSSCTGLPASKGAEFTFLRATGSILYIGFHDDKRGELYLYDAQSQRVRRLTSNSFYEGTPSVSPNGRNLAYPSERKKNVDIYVMDLVSGVEKRLTNSPKIDYGPTFSHDGKRLVYLEVERGRYKINTTTARIVEIDGSNDRALTKEDLIADPRLWGSARCLPPRTQSALGILGLSPGYRRATRETPAYSWCFPDGKRIVYASGDAEYKYRYDLYVMDLEERKPLRITRGARYITTVSVALDGSRIYFGVPNLGPHDQYLPGWIYSVRPDGSELRALVPVYGPLKDGRPTVQQPLNDLIASAT